MPGRALQRAIRYVHILNDLKDKEDIALILESATECLQEAEEYERRLEAEVMHHE